MAIATATALAIGGLALSAGTTGLSFAQAGKQKKAMRQAERDAQEAMESARKKLEVNVYENLSIQKEPFELEREALLSQGAQAIQAGVESERGAAATAGRIQMAQQEGQAGVRTAMGQELAGLERLTAQEEGRLRDVGVQLDGSS
jgi:vacuolar-type H+-ATPase subunit H